MRVRPWQVWIVSGCVFGIVGLAYPSIQKSLQSATQGNPELESKQATAALPTVPAEANQAEANQVATSQAATSQAATSQAGTTSEQTLSQAIYAQVNPAIATVYGAQGMGTGMIVRSHGLILTNKHLVDHATTVTVKTSTGQTYEGQVVDFDLRYDLALIKLTASDLQLPTVTLVPTATVKAGDRVYAIGNPDGKPGVLTTGTFLRTTEHGSLQMSAGMLSPGNSGGPLLNDQGQVIGLNKGLLDDKTGLATAIAPLQSLISRYEKINSTP